MNQSDQQKVISFLKRHKLTAQWFRHCENSYMMDAPMMVVDVIQKLSEEERQELISNTDKIELFKKMESKPMDKDAREVIKYLIGLPSRYQPPTGYKFYGDGNEQIIDQIIN